MARKAALTVAAVHRCAAIVNSLVLPVADITFIVNEAPVPKARPRVVVVKARTTTSPSMTGPTPRGRTMTFTPKTTRDFEKEVANAFMAALADNFEEWKPVVGDYYLDVVIYRAALRGDMDNFVKAVSDGLNEIAYPDDKYICGGTNMMFLDRKNPRVEVRIRRWAHGEVSVIK